MDGVRRGAAVILRSILFVFGAFRLLFARVIDLLFLNPSGLAFIVFLVGVLIVRQGFITSHADPQQTFSQLINDLYDEGGAELISIAVIAFLIDWLARRRGIRERKQDLIIQLGSPDNDFTREAARHLHCRGWIRDGTLQRVDLQGANLAGVDLWGADLASADLSGANLTAARLIGAKLNQAILNRACLAEADLEEAVLHRARLGGADLRSARLVLADLRGAYLAEVTFEGANLQRANLAGAILDHARLGGADLREANLTDVRCNSATILPDGSAWTPDAVLARFTDADHPDFWQPASENGTQTQ